MTGYAYGQYVIYAEVFSILLGLLLDNENMQAHIKQPAGKVVRDGELTECLIRAHIYVYSILLVAGGLYWIGYRIWKSRQWNW